MEINLKATLKAYTRLDESVLSKYAQKDYVDQELTKYVQDAPIGTDDAYVRKYGQWVVGNTAEQNETAHQELQEQINAANEAINTLETTKISDAPDDGKLYGRKDNAWEEVDMEYHMPEIVKFVLPEINPNDTYSVGDEITITEIEHQEINLLHIKGGTLKLYRITGRTSTFIQNITASESDVTVHLTNADTFTITGSTSYVLEFVSDVGDTYNKTVELNVRVMNAYLGENDYTEMSDDSEFGVTLINREFASGAPVNIQVIGTGYLWFCTAFEIDYILSGGSQLDIVRNPGTIVHNNTPYYCYRSNEWLNEGTYNVLIVEKLPPEPVLVGDLIIGGSNDDSMSATEIANLTRYDFSYNKAYTITLEQESYIWVCTPHSIQTVFNNGAYANSQVSQTESYADYLIQGRRVQYDGMSFQCYRFNYNEKCIPGRYTFIFS